jgi:DNA gyrase subunit A
VAESDGLLNDRVEAIARGARLRLANFRERAHILTAVLRAHDQYDDVVATMRASESADEGRQRVAELLGLDQAQAAAVTGITTGMLPQREHRRLVEDYDRAMAAIADLESVLASPERQRDLVGTDRGSYLARYRVE